MRLVPLRDEITGAVRPLLVTLLGAALLVLIVALANVANLLLVRGTARAKELGVRAALGAGRGRLLSHLLAESVLLAALGGAAGLLMAQWGGSALRAAFLPAGAVSPVMGDVRTLVFVGIAVLVVGVLTGLAPAWQFRRIELTRDLRLGVREGTPHSARTRVALLVVQGALSVLLLVGAGLFVRSLQNVQHLRLGYDVDRVLTADLEMRGVRLDGARTAALRDRLLAAVRALPGVERAALSAHVPLAGTTFLGAVRVPGMDPAAMRRLPNVHCNVVSLEYFATMGTRIVRGRGFGAGDVAGAPRAVVVSGAMARTLWPGHDALGQCVRLGARESTQCSLVVGIAEDIRHSGLSDDAALLYYLPAAKVNDRGGLGLAVRTRGTATLHVEAVRQALQREMPGGSYVTVAPFADVVGEGMRSWRLGARMFAVFGLLALVLAAVGLYGVIAYEVTQRSHEMGVRIALGARASDVLWVSVRRGVLLAGFGIVLGGVLALTASGRIAPLLFDVSPRDPLVNACVAAAMLVVAAAASFIPARRASRADPTVVLRSE
ncbi:MAG: FtsX-like permease family protein [Gemmatirosa sp.]